LNEKRRLIADCLRRNGGNKSRSARDHAPDSGPEDRPPRPTGFQL